MFCVRKCWICIHIYIHTLFQKGFHIERYIDRYILLFSCTCARVHFSLVTAQFVKKLGSTINFFFVGFFVLKEHVVWGFSEKCIRPAIQICDANYMAELVGQMSRHLYQVAKHFYWSSVLQNAALSRGGLKRNCKLTWKHLWPRVYSLFHEALP